MCKTSNVYCIISIHSCQLEYRKKGSKTETKRDPRKNIEIPLPSHLFDFETICIIGCVAMHDAMMMVLHIASASIRRSGIKTPRSKKKKTAMP